MSRYAADEGVQRREKAIEAALEEAASLLKQAKQAEASAGGTDDLFEAYLRLKEQYQEARKTERKVMRAAARMRGQRAAELLVGFPRSPALSLLPQSYCLEYNVVYLLRCKGRGRSVWN